MDNRNENKTCSHTRVTAYTADIVITNF